MQTINQKHLAAQIVNKMTIELMELTHLSREECKSLLSKQFNHRSKTSSLHVIPTEVINSQESQFINTLFH